MTCNLHGGKGRLVVEVIAEAAFSHEGQSLPIFVIARGRLQSKGAASVHSRHCEERSDAAIQLLRLFKYWIAALDTR